MVVCGAEFFEADFMVSEAWMILYVIVLCILVSTRFLIDKVFAWTFEEEHKISITYLISDWHPHILFIIIKIFFNLATKFQLSLPTHHK